MTRSILALTAVPLLAAGVAVGATAWSQAVETARPGSALDNARVEAAFSRADASGDGRVSRDESRAVPEIAARFDVLDRNRDGRLDLEEFAAAASAPG